MQIDKSKFENCINVIKTVLNQSGYNKTLIQKDGKIIFEGTDCNIPHPIFSCTKSFTSTVLGLLIDEGKCTFSTKVSDYIPSLKQKYPNVTLYHLATMTSGYNAVGCTYDEDGSPNPLLPNNPFFDPGTTFMYWDDAANMYGYVLECIAGKSLKDYFKEKIADQIQMKNWDWIKLTDEFGKSWCNSSGNNYEGITITAYDFLKFCNLFLNHGMYHNKRLLSREWVEDATRNHIPNDMPYIVFPRRTGLDGRGVYGYNWWINGKKNNGQNLFQYAPNDMYYASGLMNNKAFIIPSWNMIIVSLSPVTEGIEKVENSDYDKIFKSISSCLISNQ